MKMKSWYLSVLTETDLEIENKQTNKQVSPSKSVQDCFNFSKVLEYWKAFKAKHKIQGLGVPPRTEFPTDLVLQMQLTTCAVAATEQSFRN